MKKLFVLFALFLLFLGCIGPAPPQQQPQPQENKTNETQQQPVYPNFVIVTPKNDDVFKITDDSIDINVSLSTTNLVLKQPGGQAKIGEGHFRIILDNQQSIIVTTKSYTLKGVGVGEHTLKIELMNNDNTSYSPRIIKTVYFRVEKEVTNEPQIINVSIEDFAYNPSEVTIKVGDYVKWTNNAKFPRSITATDQSFNKLLAPGESYTFKFTKTGVYEYNSVNWPAMKGKIIVEEG
jgi:plastocyanin